MHTFHVKKWQRFVGNSHVLLSQNPAGQLKLRPPSAGHMQYPVHSQPWHVSCDLLQAVILQKMLYQIVSCCSSVITSSLGIFL